MEALMTAHHPWLASLHEFVTRQEFGRLRRVEMELVFSTPEPSNYRCHPELGGGILWDAGPYWAQLLQAILGPLTPVSLRGVSDFSGPNGVDACFEAEVDFPGGVVARLDCAFGARHVAELRLLFEDGSVRHSQFLRPAVAPFRVNLHLTRHSTGERKVLSFPPEAYSPRQLEVFLEGLRRGSDGGLLSACRERVGLLGDLHADARRRHGRAAS
jgi:predicted dehydrogenase